MLIFLKRVLYGLVSFIFSDNRKAVGYVWNLMGFVTKLAQGVSLYLDFHNLISSQLGYMSSFL